MTLRKRPDTLEPQKRFVSLRADAPSGSVDPQTRTMRISFSSEAPVDTYWGAEILSHAPGAMRTGARQASMPLLFNHDMDDLLGVVEGIELGDDMRGYATIRFGRDDRGAWAMEQVSDGVLTNVSFMYRIYKVLEDTEEETYTAIDWEPFELSLVTVPADPTVGTNRTLSNEAGSAVVETRVEPQPVAAGVHIEVTHMKRNAVLQEQANDGTSGSAGGAAVIDIKRAKDEGVVQGAAELRAMVVEIENMCNAHKLDGAVRLDLLANAKTIEEARGIVLTAIQKRGEKPQALSSLTDDLGMTEKEKAGYSLQRAIAAAAGNTWKGAGFEREVSEALAKRYGKEAENGGFLFPNDLPYAPTQEHARALRMQRRPMDGQRATYQVGTPGAGTTGGTLVATNLLADSFIEVLRNQSVTALLGARMLPGLVGAVDIPRRTLATATYWVGESGAVTEAEGTFDKVSLRPKTIGALSKVSRQMLLQTTPAIEMLIRADLAAVGALGIDLAALSGSGSSNQPTGIANQSGVNAVVGGTNGANLSFDNIIQMIYATRFANAPQSNTGFALNSKCIGYLATLKASTGQYLWDPQGGLVNGSPDRLKGRPYAESQQLRTTLTKGTASGICSELIYGDWQELLIGEWGITEIAVNPYDSTGFTTGDVIVRMFQTIDVAVRHAASFAYMSDALTPGF